MPIAAEGSQYFRSRQEFDRRAERIADGAAEEAAEKAVAGGNRHSETAEGPG